MLNKFTYGLCTVIFLSVLSTVFGQNTTSFKPGELWLDTNGVHINAHGGGIIFHDGRYWWFGEHKTEGGKGNTAQVGVHCYSSDDLYNWRDEGIALTVSDDPNSDIVRGCILERPKVLQSKTTGKFVMWFHLELKSTGYTSARSGVAIADKITGPYTYIESVRPCAGHWALNVSEKDKRVLTKEELSDVAKLGLRGGPSPKYPANQLYQRDFEVGQMARDMTLFQDDDGKAYHVYASEENGTLQIAELSDDLLKHTGKFIRVLPGGFNEAPAILKHDNKYYMITSGCTGWSPNPARLAVADSILGTWKELGNPCRGSDKQKSNTFESQSTFLLPVVGKKDVWILMADRWRPNNAIDGRYIWLPIQFDKNDSTPYVEWSEKWSLDELK